MGRIKNALIKRTARNLLKEENKFKEEFDANKKLLKEGMPSKRMKNKVAGYISRLKRMEREKTEALETE